MQRLYMSANENVHVMKRTLIERERRDPIMAQRNILINVFTQRQTNAITFDSHPTVIRLTDAVLSKRNRVLINSRGHNKQHVIMHVVNYTCAQTRSTNSMIVVISEHMNAYK